MSALSTFLLVYAPVVTIKPPDLGQMKLTTH
jgi:hypothetical protein